MNPERPRNVAASVKARLKAVARREQKPYDEVFLLYLQERLLHRLATSEYRGKFVLKGGLLIYGRKGRMARPTRDIDLLGAGLTNDPEALVRVFRELCRMEAEDGVRFDRERGNTINCHGLPRFRKALSLLNRGTLCFTLLHAAVDAIASDRTSATVWYPCCPRSFVMTST
jgi:hypothetical protein